MTKENKRYEKDKEEDTLKKYSKGRERRSRKTLQKAVKRKMITKENRHEKDMKIAHP